MIKNKEELIYSLANKYDLPLKKVKQMLEYQFKFVENIMKKGDFESIRLPYFGKFSVNPKRVKHITKLKNESNK